MRGDVMVEFEVRAIHSEDGRGSHEPRTAGGP